MRRPNRRRAGNVSVVVAVALIGILSVVALSLDGGLMVDKRRQVQSAADAAALAAADDLYLHWYTTRLSGGQSGLDWNGTAVNAAKKTAAAGGYTDGTDGCTVTVHIPPQSGPFTGMAGHTEVIISKPQKRFFSRLFGSQDVTIGARAVSRGMRNSFKNAILVLDPLGKSAFNAGGNGNVYVSGSPIQVNSTDPAAMIANGGGSSGAVVSDAFNVGGSPGWTATGGASFVGPINSSSPPIPDPYANVPPPDPSTMKVQSSKKLQNSGANTITLNPGVYIGGISLAGKVNVVLNPGIYYMQGGGFSSTSSGTLSGDGVLIYNAPQSTSDKISIQGQGTVNLTAPTTGPYQGMLFWQDRTSTVPMEIAGNGASSMIGLFYAASANLKVTGNGGQAVVGSQYISYDLTLGGNGGFNVVWTPNTVPGTRDIWLVE